jgi:thioredoxin-dependent peroxiredoxin
MRILMIGTLTIALAGLYGMFGTDATSAQEKTKNLAAKTLKVGDKAPVFTSVDDDGKVFSSSDVVGKNTLVLYFYPADFTGGCTAQACGFRDDIEKLNSKGVRVVGVSGDSVATHKLFKAKHKLPFTLLADGKAEIAQAFGVPFTLGEKSAKGENEKGEKIDVVRTATINRWTVVIDKSGKIAAIDNVSKAGDDAKRVSELVKD